MASCILFDISQVNFTIKALFTFFICMVLYIHILLPNQVTCNQDLESAN